MSPVVLSPTPVVESRVEKQRFARLKHFFVTRKQALGLSARSADRHHRAVLSRSFITPSPISTTWATSTRTCTCRRD